ncbi:lymphatic vessel endothelial hyaluronic acid receptor 1a [Mugil cephalus]|uniref:lymphatic vessel endothelial hyaluronic acid receptor 1a n=1 Tax=Mugil cephalus TaxID=48193 RepID=UPI001FB7F594|nr:lymphatic vessel endothelial hyaluronic acid receptor 1a [Mugil cephalus]
MSHIIWFCVSSLLSITPVFSDENIDTSLLKIFPSVSIVGVQQVTYLKDPNSPEYAFNASEAREVCQSLGLIIASKAQVETALKRGLETCRFGWIDEHFVVIPRIQALANCGQNRKGLVPWRAGLHQKFDVFCFNESDAAAQLKDTESNSSLSSSYYSEHTESPTRATDSTLTTHTSSYSTPKITEDLAELAHFVDSARSPAGGKAVLISCTCAVLLIAVIIVAYLKLRRSRSRSTDVQQEQQQKEYIQTEEWTCVKNIKETREDDQEDERTEDGDDTQ